MGINPKKWTAKKISILYCGGQAPKSLKIFENSTHSLLHECSRWSFPHNFQSFSLSNQTLGVAHVTGWPDLDGWLPHPVEASSFFSQSSMKCNLMTQHWIILSGLHWGHRIVPAPSFSLTTTGKDFGGAGDDKGSNLVIGTSGDNSFLALGKDLEAANPLNSSCSYHKLKTWWTLDTLPKGKKS